ncbi:MAG: aminotransferase class I/II-fold pyridoxal phosphate-dependent enzyme [Butyrivibrio sp.]|nr:aminotransferase class I/II-fold pyridoxal phosphate-dependent enzyme [Butyrivibrio sp.]
MTHGGDIYKNDIELDFSVNLNPMGTPVRIREALTKSVSRAVVYPDRDQAKARRAVAEAEALDTEQVFCGCGASELIMAVVRGEKPETALLYEPVFTGYMHALDAFGSRTLHYSIPEDNGFKFTENDLEAITGDIDMVILCDPVNPTGVSVPDDFLEAVIERAKSCGACVLLDESFFTMSDKALENRRSRTSDLIHRYENLYVIRSLTKLFSTPGIRMGYLLTCPSNIEKVRRQLPEWNLPVTSEAGIIAGMECLLRPGFLIEILGEIDKERKYLIKELKEMGLEPFESSAPFILFKGPSDLHERLIKRKILIRECSDFWGLKDGYFRIAVKNHADNERLIGELRGIVNEL